MAGEQTYSPEEMLFDLANRTRTIEGKYNLLRDRVLIINNNMIEEYKKTSAEIKSLNDNIKEIKDEMFKVKENLRHLLREMELFAKKDDVKFLEKYINLWNPMKFVTEADVIRLLEQKKGKKEE